MQILKEYTGYAFTGSRYPTNNGIDAMNNICKEIKGKKKILVGDAIGIDAKAKEWFGCTANVYTVEGKEPRHFAQRSTRMVRDMDFDCLLIGIPNKECPTIIKPRRHWGQCDGSGTWGTIALAVGLGYDVLVFLEWSVRIPLNWGAKYKWSTEGKEGVGGCWASCKVERDSAKQLSLF